MSDTWDSGLKPTPTPAVYEVWLDGRNQGQSTSVKIIADWMVSKGRRSYNRMKILKNKNEIMLEPLQRSSWSKDVTFVMNYLENYSNIDAFLEKELFEI